MLKKKLASEKGKTSEEVDGLQQSLKLQTMKTGHLRDQVKELTARYEVSRTYKTNTFIYSRTYKTNTFIYRYEVSRTYKTNTFIYSRTYKTIYRYEVSRTYKTNTFIYRYEVSRTYKTNTVFILAYCHPRTQPSIVLQPNSHINALINILEMKSTQVLTLTHSITNNILYLTYCPYRCASVCAMLTLHFRRVPDYGWRQDPIRQ